ncbi:MAG: C69 family dipeptidase, partial [Bacteroidota bacterium]|nr:C69 family dipeptidase [Bacteroidota bacterium]
SDIYAPVDFGGARFCEVRVWSMFKEVSNDMDQYIDYVKGHDLKNRMPLWIKPNRKISPKDMMNFMRDHLEGTELDMTKDLGAGPFANPYRWRPLTWEVDGENYCNERATATQQTGFSFVTQARNWLPDHIGGIFWFSVDDAATTVYNPMYCGMTEIPEPYAVGNGGMLEYSDNSAFWAFNFVSNLTYLRYNYIIKDVKKVQAELENKYLAYTPAVDKAAAELYKTDKELARQFITDYSVSKANETFRRWKKLGQFLLVKFMDGNIKQEKNGKFLENGTGVPLHPNQPGYPEEFYRKIVKQTGDKLKMTGGGH